MITIWRNESKNKTLKRILDTEIQNMQFIKWIYSDRRTQVSVLQQLYNCSQTMAEKVIWIICGSPERQKNICNVLGVEYALYDPQ